MATHSSFLPGNPMEKGAWWATVHRVAKSQTRLSKGVYTLDTNRQMNGPDCVSVKLYVERQAIFDARDVVCKHLNEGYDLRVKINKRWTFPESQCEVLPRVSLQ